MDVDRSVDSGMESCVDSVESASTVDGSVESYLEIVQPDSTADSVEGFLEDMEAESASASNSVQPDSASGSSVQPDNTSAPGSSMQADSPTASESGGQPESAPDTAKESDMGSEEEQDDIEQAVIKAMDVYSCLQQIYKFLNDSIEAQRYEQAYKLCEEFMQYRFCINCFMSKLYIINVHHAFYDKKHVFPDCIRNFLQLSETRQRAPSDLCCSSEASETS